MQGTGSQQPEHPAHRKKGLSLTGLFLGLFYYAFLRRRRRAPDLALPGPGPSECLHQVHVVLHRHLLGAALHIKTARKPPRLQPGAQRVA